MTQQRFDTQLESALKEHALDSTGNIYTVGLNDVTLKGRRALAYVNELQNESPELFAKAQTCDPVQVAIEIADCIGNEGIVEHVENAIREATRLQIQYASEAENEASA